MKVTISAYPSKYYPVQAVFALNGVRYHMVYETVEEAKTRLSARFYPKKLVFAEKTGDHN